MWRERSRRDESDGLRDGRAGVGRRGTGHGGELHGAWWVLAWVIIWGIFGEIQIDRFILLFRYSGSRPERSRRARAPAPGPGPRPAPARRAARPARGPVTHPQRPSTALQYIPRSGYGHDTRFCTGPGASLFYLPCTSYVGLARLQEKLSSSAAALRSSFSCHRARHKAASSGVAKWPRCTFLPPRRTATL